MKKFTLVIMMLFCTACSSNEYRMYHNGYIEFNSGKKYGTFSTYKVGSPYYIDHIRYRPQIYKKYDKIGIASWYGLQFHGHTLAAGGIFDMNKISAAHKTLPLPSMVLVTNLRNGKKLKVLVNDRGPYSKNRILDLSKKAAKILGYEKQGVAPVRVQLLPYETAVLQQEAHNNNGSQMTVPDWVIKQKPYDSFFDLKNPSFFTSSKKNFHRIQSIILYPDQINQKIKKGYYLQIGAYSSLHKAKKIINRLPKIFIFQKNILYKVRIGPFLNKKDASFYAVMLEKQGYKLPTLLQLTPKMHQ